MISQSTEEIDEIYNSCKSQFDTLKANEASSEMFPLAIKVKEMLESNRTSASQVAQFKALKDGLPLSVRVIIWSEKTHIFNRHYDKEYMYAVVDRIALDENRRFVYSWIPGGRDKQGEWEFATKDNGKTFLIRNVLYNEYLYAAANDFAYDSSRRRTFTWRPGTDDGCEWIVEIVSNNEIMLRFTSFDEYMYAGEDSTRQSSQRRNVFTWRPSKSCDNTCVWRLSPDGKNNEKDCRKN